MKLEERTFGTPCSVVLLYCLAICFTVLLYRAFRSFGSCRSASTTILTIPFLTEGGQCIRYCVEAKGFRTLSYEFCIFIYSPLAFFMNLCKKYIYTAKMRRQQYLLYKNFYILPPFFLNLKYLKLSVGSYIFHTTTGAYFICIKVIENPCNVCVFY